MITALWAKELQLNVSQNISLFENVSLILDSEHNFIKLKLISQGFACIIIQHFPLIDQVKVSPGQGGNIKTLLQQQKQHKQA